MNPTERPDMVELATNLIQDITGGTPPEYAQAQASVAQAAALIAIAERLDTLIGHIDALNTHIGDMHDGRNNALRMVELR